ncbi:Uncharacterized conserved protein [Janthinobacterium sp. Marseille]|uniref:Sigma-70 family RNA polymerase sigma factor n=1 Tax=Herminiimonas aquatilis TaxID=345342 RepID=A0ABW2J8R3_9BURK|nr:sigma-70 family RNA polymerase sigma factor [Janthinobacterium sp. Marseille]ABR91403.1 Uncharacterized conserved protein [Janthinobacterium sp. Marseille]
MSIECAAAPIAIRIEEALSRLTDADLFRLYRRAAIRLRGTGLADPQELFNEAVLRVLEGDRKWPSHVKFEAFILMTMRSIADGYRNLIRQDLEHLANDSASVNDEQESDLMDGFGDSDLAVDNVLIDEEARRRMAADLELIENHFKNDEAVTLVIMAIEDKIPPRELEADYGLTITKYESARKKLRRGADSLFPGRRKA